MRIWSELRERLRALFDRRRVERELDEELAFHLEKETEKQLARGMSPEAARREAYRRFGGVELRREHTREAWGVRGVEAIGRDVRLGVRRALRSPGFTAVATLTLALGIGGTSAMFGVVNVLLLRPLPYPHDDRLVWIASEAMITPDNLVEWRAGMPLLAEMGAFRIGGRVLTGRGAARNVVVMPVDEEYLQLLGARPERGRVWSADEGRAGAAPVALVSHRLWMEELGGEGPEGKTITVGDRGGEIRYDVVGVLPADFHNLGYDAELWVPLSHGVGSFHLIGRLRPGAAVAQAQRQVDALLTRLAPQPGSDLFGQSAEVSSVRERFAGDVRTPVLVLFGAAGFVLLLALANLATLLLSRAGTRARELSVRSALGGGQAALVRQSLVESGVLALAGGALGLLLAHVGLGAIVALAPESLTDALVGSVRIDPAVLAIAILLTAVTTLLAGLAPALGGARAAAGTTRTRATATLADRRLREALVGLEVALALVMLIGTALLVRTYWTLRPASPGFEVEDRLVAPLTLPGRLQVRDNLGPPPEDPANIEMVRALITRIETAAPGARAAAVTWLPLSGNYMQTRVVEVDGTPRQRADGGPLEMDMQSASPSYFDVMGIGLTAGRGLQAGDVAGAPRVVVVSKAAARALWPDVASPIGRQLLIDPYGADRPRPPDADRRPPAGPQLLDVTVVGVTGDVRGSGTNTRTRPQLYVSYWQIPWPTVHLVVHTPRGGFTAKELSRAVAALDRTVPVGEVTTVAAIAGSAVAQPRYEMTLMAIFGALAAILAVIGCYGVMAYTVAQRTREIGVRMALGATRETVARGVLARGARVVGVGVAAGALLALLLTRLIESSLYGISPTDPATFLLASVALASAALLAAWIPARRAARIDPVRTLKEE